jgi:hypothetical protein
MSNFIIATTHTDAYDMHAQQKPRREEARTDLVVMRPD